MPENSLKNKTDYKRLGDYIREVDSRNRDLAVTKLMGINIGKFFMPSVANVIGTDLSNYKVVFRNCFACNLMHVGRDEKIPIALHDTDEKIIISPAYFVFEISKPEELLPAYLMMWFRRREFDRNAWFYTDSDVRGGMSRDAFCDLKLPIPPLSRQREIVAEYETLTRRIRLNERLISTLESAAQTLYRRTFVDNIDPARLPPGWRTGTLGEMGEIVGGATPSTNVSEYWIENGIRWISPADISKQKRIFIEKGEKDITEKGYKSASTRLVPAGTVLFSSRAPIGLVAIADCELCTNQGFKSIVPLEKFGTYYAYCLLKDEKERIEAQCSGSIFAEVSGATMKNHQILIPPIDLVSKFNFESMPIFNHLRLVERELHALTEMSSLALSKIGQS